MTVGERKYFKDGALRDDVDTFVADVEQYAALGVSEIHVMPDRHPVEFIEQFAGQVLPRLTTTP